MDDTGKIKNRRIIPRWRELKRIKPWEASCVNPQEPLQKPTDDLLREYYNLWQYNPTIENALDVLYLFDSSTDKGLVYGPAEQILRTKGIPLGLRALAEKTKSPKFESKINNLEEDLYELQRRRVQDARRRLVEEPRNSLLWLELSRLQVALGNRDSSEVAMRRALAISPENRIIMRASSRLFVHLGLLDDAHIRLKKSELIKHDPWIQSAEIAVASLKGATSVSLGVARKALSLIDNMNVHYSELAAAVGTEELKNGNYKSARKLFHRGMKHPTDNSWAQAVWASSALNINIDGTIVKHTPYSYEALSDIYTQKGDYDDAIQYCLQWHYDEPFSIHPIATGTFLSTTFLEDYNLAYQFYKLGIRANPDSLILLNNGAVVFSKLNKLKEAEFNLTKIHAISPTMFNSAVVMATRGLLSFSAKDFEKGRRLYQLAFDRAVKDKDVNTAFRVKMHWLYEESCAEHLSLLDANEIFRYFDMFANSPKSMLRKEVIDAWKLYKERIKGKVKGHVSKTSLNHFQFLGDF